MPEADSKPLISFCILAYNQERYVREAVAGALAQTYSPLEVILSDDCSPDSTFEIISTIARNYTGPHRIVANRNPKNLGIANHFNRVVSMASGDVVVVAAGDDVSLPGRTSESWRILREDPDATCVAFEHQLMDADGTTIGCSNAKSARGSRTEVSISDLSRNNEFAYHGASRAFRKKVFSTFGPLYETCPTEDSTMFLRCLMMGKAAYSEDIGIRYRVHGSGISTCGNVHRIKHRRVFRQWIADIRKGSRLGLIDPATEALMRKWAIVTVRRRLFYAKAVQSKTPFTLLKHLYFYRSVVGIREGLGLALRSCRNSVWRSRSV